MRGRNGYAKLRDLVTVRSGETRGSMLGPNLGGWKVSCEGGLGPRSQLDRRTKTVFGRLASSETRDLRSLVSARGSGGSLVGG